MCSQQIEKFQKPTTSDDNHVQKILTYYIGA